MPIGLDDAAMAAAAGAASSAGGILGQVIAGSQNRAATGKQMRWQDANIKKAMDFQREMSSSAYQRSVADMKKAGLNPMLLASKGFSPASVPTGGGSGSASTPSFANVFANLPASISTGLDLARTFADVAKTKAETGKVVASTPKTKVEGDIFSDIGDMYSSAKAILHSIGTKLGGAIYESRHPSKY